MVRKTKTHTMQMKRHTSKSKLRHPRGGSLWGWIKNTAMPWVKKNKLISKGLNMLGPYGQIAGTAADALGYGKGNMRGRGVVTDFIKKHATMANLRKMNTVARDKKYISRGLLHYGSPGGMVHNAGRFAQSIGYGSCGGSLGGSLGYGKKKR
jgi:hypothetical protein